MRRAAYLLAAVGLALAGCDETKKTDIGPLPSASAAPVSAPSAAAAPKKAAELSADELSKHAEAIAKKHIILDGHVDVPYRLQSSRGEDGELTEDISKRTEKGDFDYPRARAGGLDAPFMSIYVPAKYEQGGAKKLADELIDMVEGFVKKSPNKFALATSPADVRRNFAAKKISLPMGLENGSPIERDLKNIEHFRSRGIRYITLAHSKDNHISDSSYDKRGTNGGLSDFGKKVVVEMNRLGIMVDVSHLSDAAFDQVMEVTRVPAIASHSSCRHFTPGWERNMSDAMIKALARNGGVIQINFGSGFLDKDIQTKSSKLYGELGALLEKKKLAWDAPKAKPIKKQFWEENRPGFSTVEKVADHIEHVIKLVGVDHVGLGSDFDGVGDSLPTGLKDVSEYPNLIAVLLKRGHREEDVEKILSGNVFRVWQKVDDYAKKSAGAGKESEKPKGAE